MLAEQNRAALKIQSIFRQQREKYRSSVKRARNFYTHELILDKSGDALAARPSAKRRLYIFLEDPSSSKSANITSMALLSTIVVSISGFILETTPELLFVSNTIWQTIEVVSSIIFTVEYCLRFAVCDEGGLSKGQFLLSILNLFDLMAILPFWVEVVMQLFLGLNEGKGNLALLRVLRAVRLVRLFRVFKLGRYSSGMKLMGEAIKNSFHSLWVLVLFLLVGVVLASSLMYYVEKLSCPTGEDMSADEAARYKSECADMFNSGVSPSFGLCCDSNDAPRDFPSIFSAMWWAIVTMTTVGFGDISPRTPAGKAVGFGTMLVGMVLIALPVAIVGQKFQDAYDTHGDLKVSATRPSRMGPEKWVLNPEMSEHVAQIKRLKINDEVLAENVDRFLTLIDEVQERRGKIAKDQLEEMNRQRVIHRTFTDFLDGLGEAGPNFQKTEEEDEEGVSEKNAWVVD